MAYRETYPKKLAFLLSNGAHEGELKKFFAESRTQLLIKGAKVQNLPYGRYDRIQTICKLPRKADDVLHAWFEKNISVAAPEALDEVLMYLEAYFDNNEPLPESEAKVICRSALVYLFKEVPDASFLGFMQRSIGASADEIGASIQAVELPADPSNDFGLPADTHDEMLIPKSHQLAELLASIIVGDEGAVDNALIHFDKRTRVLVEALLQVREGDVDAARKQLTFLGPNDHESELLKSVLARSRHQRASNVAPIGIQVVIPKPLSDDLDIEAYEIVGIYTNESDNGAIFVQPLFVIVGGQLRHLTTEDRIRLFPESGSVMTHKSMLRRPPKRRELVHWSVSERDGAEGKTRFHLETELNPLLEVIRIPVPSTDADEVRDRVKAIAVARGAQSGQQMMFQLSDGVVVASPRGSDFSRDDAFGEPWQAWGSLETWLIEGRQYCLEASQGEASQLDLSPLDTSFRRLLKNLVVKQKLTITKAQRREIVELLRSESGADITQRAKRIADSMDQISLSEDDLEVVLGLLESNAKVHQRVDELIARQFEERQGEKTGLLRDISTLRKTKADLEAQAREIERHSRLQEDSVVSSVREAFASAIHEGTRTLANAEIFQMLMGGSGVSREKFPVAGMNESGEWITRGLLSATDVSTRLSMLGINKRQSFVLAALSDLAGQCGFALILKGGLARQCVRTLVRQNRDTVAVIDIPMGLTSCDFLRHKFRQMEGVDGIALLNADLSPFEIYGAELLDLLVGQSLDEISNQRPILMACLGGDMSLPLPNSLRRVSLMVDLDSEWDQGQQLLDDIDLEAVVLLPTLQERVVERMSALDNSSSKHVERALVRAATLHQ